MWRSLRTVRNPLAAGLATVLTVWATLGVTQPAAAAALQEDSPAVRAEAPKEQNDPSADVTETDPAAAAALEAKFMGNVRQLTFEGARAGEGYFSRDGKRMVLQSEREADNPFFQIYLLDLESGDTVRVSPGHGKTTCGWIHPDGGRVLFASTHEDPDARQKQQAELESRKAGRQKRYAWDYDEHYELYAWDQQSGAHANLTKTRGYDAEGSWSPDGRQIAFTSNRLAYASRMSDEQNKQFELDPAFMNDIYVMDGDGANVRRLTDAPGYDGGPFFSPDGKRICWRRFSPDGATAEIMTMNVDGSDPRQLTRMGAMSWAPFYHPSGEYLIFTTNRHGFANFELYLVDVAGQRDPVRVSRTKGFDGLPAFSPDGRRLAWTSNRTSSGQSQIFLADWNDAHARRLLGLDRAAAATADVTSAVAAAAAASQATSADFAPQDIRRHVEYLCRPELEGRLTGTQGEQLATAYVAAYMDKLGLQPGGDNGTFFQTFEFTSGVALGKDNSLAWGERSYEAEKDYLPVSFSKTGPVDAAPVVFAGYGITAPKDDLQAEYDSFVHLDVAGKWVLAFRYLPEQVAAERRQQLSRFASLRYKAMLARDKGARGLILVSGPNSQAKQPLVRLQFDGTLAGASVPVISVTDDVAQQWLAGSGKKLKELQDKLDTGENVMGFELPDVQLSATIDIQQVKRTGRNVLGYLRAGERPSPQMVVVGAHVDHLGKGAGSSSLAKDDEREGIHFGADDNASGVAGILEIAESLTGQKAEGQWKPARDVLFAAWSGEELGLIGSGHFIRTFPAAASAVASAAEPAKPVSVGPHGSSQPSLYPGIAACLNLDMVGRLDKKLILQGVGSSGIWRGEIERRNVPVGLPIALQDDSYLPTDANAFYLRGVPILSAFTGSHGEYHTPRDRPETLNYEGAAKVSRLMALIARSLATRDAPPDYIAQSPPKSGSARAGLRAYLGTIPDYAEGDVKGVKLSGVAATGPAAKAGVRGGDVIVELAGKKVDNIYDYTYAIEALKIGQPVKLVVQRGAERVELTVTPGSRE